MTKMNRDVDPQFVSKEAIVARILYGERYSRQSLGQVDFWERLSSEEKKTVVEVVDQIERCQLRSR